MVDPQWLEREDKRKAAIHEAGHVVVAAMRDGIYSGCGIWRNESDDPDEKSWLGRTNSLAKFSPVGGIAGVVAERWIDENETDAWQIACDIEDGIIEPSATDWRSIGDREQNLLPLVNESLAVLKANRDLFDWVVAELLEDGVVTDGMVKDECRARRLR